MSNAESTITPEPQGGWPVERALLIGSEDFPIPEAIPRVLSTWWHGAGAKPIILVVEEGNIGALAQQTLDTDSFTVEMHTANLEHRYPERDLLRRLLAIRPTHAFVFRLASDHLIESRVTALYVQGIPTTIVQVEEL